MSNQGNDSSQQFRYRKSIENVIGKYISFSYLQITPSGELEPSLENLILAPIMMDLKMSMIFSITTLTSFLLQIPMTLTLLSPATSGLV